MKMNERRRMIRNNIKHKGKLKRISMKENDQKNRECKRENKKMKDEEKENEEEEE